jgi:hypothetical protein
MDWLKELLKQLGVEESKIDGAVSDFGKEIPKHFVPKSQYNDVTTAKKTAEDALKDRDKQLEDLKKASGDSAALQDQITKLQGENKATTEKYDADLKELKLNTAIKLALAGDAHDPDIVAGLLDKSKIELDDSGAVKGGLDDLLKPLRESKGFLFAEKQEEAGNKFKGASPKDGKDKKAGDPPDFTLMSDEEYYRYKESQDSKK